MNGARAQRLELRASLALTAAVLGVHDDGAAGVLAALPLPWGAAPAAALGALGVAAAAWDRALLRGARSVRALELVLADEVIAELRDGERRTVHIAARPSVNGLLAALPVRFDRRRSLMTCADMLARGAFRMLRLWALWGRVPSGSALALGVKA